MKFIIIFFFISCSSQIPRAALSSDPPGVNVSLKEAGGKLRSIGVTPLETEIPRAPTTLIFSKEGYSESHVLVSLSEGERGEFFTKLKSSGPERDPEAPQKIDRLGRDLVRAHNLMGSKKYVEAQAILSQLTREYPMVSVSYDLLGNLAYLERDQTRALQNYEKSLSINPENPETRRMVQRLKGNP